MDEAEERRIWKRDAAELRRSEVYPPPIGCCWPGWSGF